MRLIQPLQRQPTTKETANQVRGGQMVQYAHVVWSRLLSRQPRAWQQAVLQWHRIVIEGLRSDINFSRPDYGAIFCSDPFEYLWICNAGPWLKGEQGFHVKPAMFAVGVYEIKQEIFFGVDIYNISQHHSPPPQYLAQPCKILCQLPACVNDNVEIRVRIIGRVATGSHGLCKHIFTRMPIIPPRIRPST